MTRQYRGASMSWTLSILLQINPVLSPTLLPFPLPEVVGEQVNKLFQQRVCFEVCYIDGGEKKKVEIWSQWWGRWTSIYRRNFQRSILKDSILVAKYPPKSSETSQCSKCVTKGGNQRDPTRHHFQWPTGGFRPSCPHNSGFCRVGGLGPWRAHSK